MQADIRTDRKTNIQTYRRAHRNASHLYWGQVNVFRDSTVLLLIKKFAFGVCGCSLVSLWIISIKGVELCSLLYSRPSYCSYLGLQLIIS